MQNQKLKISKLGKLKADDRVIVCKAKHQQASLSRLANRVHTPTGVPDKAFTLHNCMWTFGNNTHVELATKQSMAGWKSIRKGANASGWWRRAFIVF